MVAVHKMDRAGERIQRLVGQLHGADEDEVEDLLSRFFVAEPLFDAGDELLQAEELAALVLLELKGHAEDHRRKRITKCVIAIPAYFTYAQRECTRAAAKIAGLEVERLVNEPSAAAIGYSKTGSLSSRTVVVFDLGGGTFDVSVLEFDNGPTQEQQDRERWCRLRSVLCAYFGSPSIGNYKATAQ